MKDLLTEVRALLASLEEELALVEQLPVMAQQLAEIHEAVRTR